MKSVIFLDTISVNNFAFSPLNSGRCAFQLCVDAVKKFCDDFEIVVLCNGVNEANIKAQLSGCNDENVKILVCSGVDGKSIFEDMYGCCKDCDNVFFVFADSPFLDAELTKRLYDQHLEFKAEYSFVDGYPEGLAPQVFATGLLPIFGQMSDVEDVTLNRNFIFDTIKKDVNSFDIETIIADEDIRHLRVKLYVNSKRQFDVCNALYGINAQNYAEVIAKNEDELFSFPAFYGIDICNAHKGNSIYLPKVEFNDSVEFMPLDKAKLLIQKIADYSDDAVISLSVFGDPVRHPNLEEIVEFILQFSRLSVLIETFGLNWRIDQIEKINGIVKGAYKRENGHSSIYWIVMIDAVTGSAYSKVHGVTESDASRYLDEVSNFVNVLFSKFGDVVFPQFMRMNENEEELESFYRFWKEQVGNVIIQKYDHFCNLLPDRRVADLAPLIRRPCWHLKRDMFVLCNGDVMLCKDDVKLEHCLGNVFVNDFAEIRSKAFPIYQEHVGLNYKGLCENCDEYYTYNF